MKKLVAVLAVFTTMAVPTLGIAAMAGSNTVNSAAIVDGSVATVDLANGAVTGAKIAAGTITSTHLATESVTAAKISGNISVDKLATFEGVKVVHTGPADNVNTFNSINAAITAAAPTNSIVKVMPGTYNENVVYSTPMVLAGSGEDVTVINGTVNWTGVAAHPAKIADLTITGSFSNAYAPTTMESVIINGQIGTYGTATINNSTLSGIATFYDLTKVSHSTFGSAVFFQSPSAPAEIKDSDFSGDLQYGYSTFMNSGAAVAIINSKIAAGPGGMLGGNNAAGIKLINCYDAAYGLIPNQ